MKNLYLFCALIFLFAFAHSQSFDNGFVFNLPWNDTAKVDFLPAFDQKTISDDDDVSVDEQGNFLVNGEAYRFFGVNLTARGAFPMKEEAAIIAARMKKFGINLVRFHHIDNPWSDGSLFHGISGTREFNQELLDRLDYLIYQLKIHGIYVNMNLNVSRTFESVDGVVAADSLSNFGKGVTLFNPRMIELQKEYAQMLLEHVNPYTGLALADDPVLAMVEIINENSLFRMWYTGELKGYPEGGSLPAYYNNQLDSLWNSYIAEKYSSDQELMAAWGDGVFSGDTIFYDGFEQGIGTEWSVELHNTAAATASLSNDPAAGDSAAFVEVTSTSDVDWHTKFKYVGASVTKDSVYELRLKAKSETPQKIRVGFQRDNSPWTFYAGYDFMLDTSYQELLISFKAPEDNQQNLRVGISFDNKTGNFWFDEFVLRKQSKHGLLEDESITKANVRRIKSNLLNFYTRERVQDMTAFYADLQIRFLTEMRTWLKDSLRVKAPLAGTNWFTGPEDVYVQNTLDYIDNHAYWDHPQFPVTPWSPVHWKIRNTPMLSSESGTVENLFNGLIVKDKPYTVSEYNHAFPNQYQPELLPVITSYLSFNDADGLMLFQYNSNWDYRTNRIDRYFDIHRNTGLMGSYPLFSYVFRKGLINPGEVIEVNYSYNDILNMPYSIENWWSAHFPYDSEYAYKHRIEIKFEDGGSLDSLQLPDMPESPYSLNESMIFWDKEGIFKVNTEKFSSISGYLNRFPGQSTDVLTVSSASGFAGIHWLSLTDSSLTESSRSVLNVATKVQNTGMIWDDSITVHNNWGVSPVLVYPLQIESKLKTRFDYLIITRLDETGEIDRKSSDTLKANESGWVNYVLDQRVKRSIWYAVEGFNKEKDTLAQNIPYHKNDLVLCFPNPARNQITMKFPQDLVKKPLKVSIFNSSGSFIKEFISEDPSADYSIDIAEWSPGTYFFHVLSPGKKIHGKFMVIP